MDLVGIGQFQRENWWTELVGNEQFQLKEEINKSNWNPIIMARKMDEWMWLELDSSN